MSYDFRNISLFIPEIHSRYYIDTNGVVYTSLSQNTDRITVNGEKFNIKSFKRNNLQKLNSSNNMMIALPRCQNYFLLYNGLVIKRLATRISEKKEVDVCLTTLTGRDKGERFRVHRLMGFVFLGLKESEEIHHIDQDRTNNKLFNLKKLSFEEHRGQGNYSKNHS